MPDVRAAIVRFNDAINRRDLTAIASMLTEDTVLENSNPSPDGRSFRGKPEVMAFWEQWLAANPDAHFELEEVIPAGQRCTTRWIYRKMRDGAPWHLRGVDVFTLRDGKIAAKLTYVKG